MISWISQHKCGPIGIDIGARSVKLVQFSNDRRRLIEASRWDFANEAAKHGEPPSVEQQVEALRCAVQGREFQGRNAILCLGGEQLFLRNVRAPKGTHEELAHTVHREAAGRLPYSIGEAEIRFLEAADVRQGEAMVRELIVLACHRPALERLLETVEAAGLRPTAVDAEPTALARAYAAQFRRDEDRTTRAMFIHLGFSRTLAAIVEGDDLLFAKYLDVGGRQMDEAVARSLGMPIMEAAALRRHNGDRRAESQDPEVSRSIVEAIRPVVEQLGEELSLCMRYHSVTFRGRPLVRAVLGGGEASGALAEALTGRLGLSCEVSDSFRHRQAVKQTGRKGQWDVAAGLALRELN